MLTVYSKDHCLHAPRAELHAGVLGPPFETPGRAEIILDAIKAQGLGDVIAPRDFGTTAIEAVHDHDYLSFLRTAHAEWRQAGHESDAVPWFWPARRMHGRRPEGIEGRLGYYALGCDTAITETSWRAAYASAQVAIEGAQQLVDGRDAAFGLCRPPGHHAARDLYGGYCFLNNAAIAAAHLRVNGFDKLAIVDVDFHHGNGTQDIFYRRADVLCVSIHGDPRFAFPVFTGYADETGQGEGLGLNLNLPLPEGTGFADWRAALGTALGRVAAFGAKALVVSLGVDTYRGDPISFFDLATEDFRVIGADIADFALPTLFVMEGGYAVDEIGRNTVNVLTGFDEQAAARSENR